MSDLRTWMAKLETFEEKSSLDEFAQMNLDRTSTLLAILGGGYSRLGLSSARSI